MRHTKNILTVATISLLSFLIQSVSLADVSKSQSPVRVACVGDSITAGVGASGPNNYPTVLAKLLGSNYEVRNFGESGATLLKNGDSPYWKRPSFAPSAQFLPNIVIIMLGTNDCKTYNWNAHKSEFKGDYIALLDYYGKLSTHPKLYVCAPIFVVDGTFQMSEKNLEEEIVIIKEVAAEKGAKLIDAHSEFGFDPKYLADGCHPNNAGYLKLTSSIYRALTNSPIIALGDNATFVKTKKVAIEPVGSDEELHYTLNGKEPGLKSPKYMGPIEIKKATTIKARIFRNGKAIGRVAQRRFETLKYHSALSVNPLQAGVSYKYYEAVFQSARDLKAAAPLTESTQADFRLSMNKVQANFGVAFETYIYAPEDGLYTFGVNCDDGGVMSIDGEMIVNNDGTHGADLVTSQILLRKGYHKINADYFQQGGGYSFDVCWQKPGEKALTPFTASELHRL